MYGLPENGVYNPKVSQSHEKTDSTPTVLDHLKDVYQASISKLNIEEQKQLADLLIEYQDVFATNEFDL